MENQILKYYQISSKSFSSKTDTIQMLIAPINENGLKDIVDILDDKIMSIIDLLEKKHVARYQVWNEVMQERIIKNANLFTKKLLNKYFFLITRK